MLVVRRRWVLGVLAVVGAAGLTGCSSGEASKELVIYSARNEQLIKPIFERYTQESGVPIRFVTDDAGPLIERLAAENKNSPADILLTVDAGELWHAAERGLFQPVQSQTLEANIPAHLRDPQDRWFGLSLRARTIVYNPNKVEAAAMSSYADLADPKWKGRLCLRTSKKVYNQSLVAMLIAEHGEPKAEEIVKGWIANLATDVFSSDNLVMEAIAAGQCDVGIINTYYYGRLLRDKPDLPLKLFWVDQDGAGVHVNVSGAGVTAHAPQAQEAIRFLEWLSSAQAQEMFAASNLEFPANPEVAKDPIVAQWGDFKQHDENIAQAGALQAQAVKLMDRAGYR